MSGMNEVSGISDLKFQISDSFAAERICVIKPSAFGDVVQALPLVTGLRERFPDAAITWVVNQELADLVSGHPGISEVLCFDRRGTLWNQARLLSTLRSRRFELVLDLQGLFRTAIMTAVTGAPVRIGLETAREGAARACTHTVPGTGRDVPAHVRYWRVAEWLGSRAVRPPVQMHIPDAAEQAAEQRLAPLRAGGRRVLAIHAGAKWETKRWPASKFIEVVRRLSPSVSLVLIGSPSERDTTGQIAAAALSRGHRVLDVAGKTTLKELAAMLRRTDAVLSNDSGPMHLAAELGVPVVGVFTCTSPVRSGPPGPLHVLSQAAVPCAAGYHKSCPHTGPARHACFDALDPARLAAAAMQLLGFDSELRRSA